MSPKCASLTVSIIVGPLAFEDEFALKGRTNVQRPAIVDYAAVAIVMIGFEEIADFDVKLLGSHSLFLVYQMP